MRHKPKKFDTDAELPPEFDVELYVSHPSNPDLAGMNEEQARKHYVEFGLREGRVASAIDSRDAFFSLVSPSSDALEIGPFFRPMLIKATHTVSYLDVCSTAELRHRAAGISDARPDEVPDIDFVWQGEDYHDICKKYFDIVISSHNIEHSPCLVDHLRQVGSILKEGCCYFIAIPDKRYCFDHFFPQSTIEEILEAFLGRRKRHLPSKVLEHKFFTTHNDSMRHWNRDHGEKPRLSPSDKQKIQNIQATLEEISISNSYIDVHAWQFTPGSFIDIIETLDAMGLIPLQIERVYSTLKGSNEFYAVLRKREYPRKTEVMAAHPKHSLRSAAATWNDPNESLESVNARIHDGVPLDRLAARADEYIRAMADHFPYLHFPPRPVCLEIGPGTGYVMEALHRELRRRTNPPAWIGGLDIAENMLARAKARLAGKGPFRFPHYDGVSIPLPDASVDLVLSVATLPFIPKPYVYNLFFEMRRIVKPGGFVVFQLLSFRHLPEQETHSPWREEIRRQIGLEVGHWHHFYSREELEAVLKTGTGIPFVDLRESGGAIWVCFHEEKLPLPRGFDPERYLELNPDVRGADPVRHWQEYGYKEGRKWG